MSNKPNHATISPPEAKAWDRVKYGVEALGKHHRKGGGGEKKDVRRAVEDLSIAVRKSGITPQQIQRAVEEAADNGE